MFFTFQEKKIYYRAIGKGKTPIILLHGFLHDNSMWNQFIEKSGNSLHCILFDLPGHGKSEIIQDVTIDKMAEMLYAFIKENDFEQVTLLGHSLGGYVSLAFEDKYPSLLNKKILYHSSAYADSDEVKKKRNLWLKIIEKHPSMFVKNVIEYLYDAQSLLNFNEKVQEDIEKARLVGYAGYIEAIKAMRDRPNRFHLMKSKIPTYFLAGKLDKIINEEVSKEHIAEIQNGNGFILENASHMSFVEDSENAFEKLRDYLNK